ncbi:hypothetical protein MMYC01_205978 [Madurella mycetomatis]|uniref:Uncharacterized protein n=1 Tax=Madurella mycetomatis TaxID=100816 RepID=A0A175W1P5_9PEZI|nr:hypothetical protein MMYC01_205978 [Madurella mycetomatis]
MKYLAIAVLFLPATALANPMVSARQPSPRAKFIGTFSTDQSCRGASVEFDEINEVATVSLPNYSVRLPGPDRERACSVTLPVRFPVNACTTGTAFGTVSGQVTLPDGVEGRFHARDYVVSPGGVNQTSPDQDWRGPVDMQYTLSDTVSYRYDRPDSVNRDVNFTLPGRLQLQPSNGPSGFLSNDLFVFDIRTQIPCCEFNALLLPTASNLVALEYRILTLSRNRISV